MHDASVALAHHATELGVRGIVRKTLPPELLRRCLQVVAGGGTWFERSLTQELMDARKVALSRRESQLVRLATQGLSNKEIAHALALSEGTVKYYFSRLFRKLGVHDRIELALCGLKNLMNGHPDGSELPDVLGGYWPRSLVTEVRAERAPQADGSPVPQIGPK